MEKSDVFFLSQIVTSLGQAEILLEQGYEENDFEKFQRAKKLILNLQKEVDKRLND